MPKINLTNEKFEYFTVLEKDTTKTGKNTYWKCRCICGNIFSDTTTNIKRGIRKSCGCMKSKIISDTHFQDLTGKTFGELFVIERNYNIQKKKNSKQTFYNCKCSCGNIISVERGKLIRGQISCGCKNSIGEFNINKILQENNIKYISQFTNSELKTLNNGYLKFDFAILNSDNTIKRLIEFDGIQHFSTVKFFNDNELKQRDLIKNQYATENNIPLIRIPYYKKNTLSLEDLLGDTFLI